MFRDQGTKGRTADSSYNNMFDYCKNLVTIIDSIELVDNIDLVEKYGESLMNNYLSYWNNLLYFNNEEKKLFEPLINVSNIEDLYEKFTTEISKNISSFIEKLQDKNYVYNMDDLYKRNTIEMDKEIKRIYKLLS